MNYIESYFISNYFYKKDYIKDYISSTKINGKTIQSIQTYVLTNQLIDDHILEYWTNQSNKYNKSIYKSCYGTFLTGLTHMFLYNAMTTVLDYKLNVSQINIKDTQMRVNVDLWGNTNLDIDDEDYTTKRLGTNETNIKIHTFLSGFYGSYLEGLVLNLAGDNKSCSAVKWFSEDFFTNKTLNFTYNNVTKEVTIHTQNNNDYLITLGENGTYTYTIIDTRESIPKKASILNNQSLNETLNETETDVENETLYQNGGKGSKAYGYNYENNATDSIFNFLNSYDSIMDYINNWWNQVPEDEQELFWQVFNTAEDLSGSVMITMGVAVFSLGAPLIVPTLAIAGGITLCYLATGVNSVDDLGNPYYVFASIPSIATSIVGVSVESKILALTEKTLLDKLVCSLGNSLYHNKLTSTKQLFQTSFLDSIDGFYYNAFLNSCGFHEND